MDFKVMENLHRSMRGRYFQRHSGGTMEVGFEEKKMTGRLTLVNRRPAGIQVTDEEVMEHGHE